MQVTETSSEGLKRAYKVVFPVTDLAQRLDAELFDMKDKVQIKGFRPGKIPMTHLKKVYGKQVMADVMQKAVNEANQKIIEDNSLKLAAEPKIDVDGGDEGVEKAISAQGDLAFTVNFEVMPTIELKPFSGIELERQVFSVEDKEVEEAMNSLVDSSRPYVEKDGAAADKDKVTLDFAGKIEGEAFAGGTGSDMEVTLGSGTFIPGFEEQLTGIKAGEDRQLNVTFPAEYQAAHLAGKAAVFDVTAKKIETPGEVELNDEFAKKFGVETMDELKKTIREDIQKQYDNATRQKMKRVLLDKLDTDYSFELPESLLEHEFNGIWQQAEQERKQANQTLEQAGFATEEAAREEFRTIAQRRVRLGLLLAQVGEESKVEVSEQELTAGIVERVREIGRQFPGQEQAAWDYFRKNEEAVAQVRAPLFEEKVIDIIFAQAKVSEKAVTREELMKFDGEEAANPSAAAEKAE
ncbi:MAG: trigger factor [Beijerinckiaceae bacterium]|nr:trigger factor [Beijerinckiaceae bacterium]